MLTMHLLVALIGAHAAGEMPASPPGHIGQDVRCLAMSHGLKAVPLVRDEKFDELFGEPVSRFESTDLDPAAKQRLWDAFVKAMKPYGEPRGPDCGYALMSYSAEGVTPPYMGSGECGGRYYTYFLDEFGGPKKTVVLRLHSRPLESAD